MSRKRDNRRNSKERNVISLHENIVTQPTRPVRKKRVHLYPKNLNQEIYLEKLNDPDKIVIFAVGPAGTGKTLLAVQWAIDQFNAQNFGKIIVTRPAVSVDEEHGFLPGDLNEKMAPWTMPITSIMKDNFSAQELEGLIREGLIETSPLAYMRGRNFANSVILADEMQLCTPNQMKMVLTRISHGSKLVVTGDLEQADRGKNNGLFDFMDKMKSRNSERIEIIRFNNDDIERHPVVSEILDIYNESDK